MEKEAHLHGVAKAIAKCQRQLEDKETEWANDLRKLTASYKEAKEELGAQADQLRAARKEKADAERALHKGLEEAHEVLEASQAKLSEQSVLAASFAGHASEALKQEMLAIFGAQDMLNQARVQASQRFGPGLNAAENVMGASTANSVLSGGISATRLSHLMKTVTPDTSRNGSPAGARGSPAYRRAQADAALLLAGQGRRERRARWFMMGGRPFLWRRRPRMCRRRRRRPAPTGPSDGRRADDEGAAEAVGGVAGVRRVAGRSHSSLVRRFRMCVVRYLTD